jgi:hypothetical protein
MYRSNQRYQKHKTLLRFTILVCVVLLVLFAIVWWIIVRGNHSTSANFDKVGNISVNRPDTKDFTTPYFKISLPKTWEEKGRQNPYSYEVYYLYHNTEANYDNRWLRVYVDVFKQDMPLNRMLPIALINNKISSGVLSDDCTVFTGAPTMVGGQKGSTAPAKWQGISFVCDFATPQNVTGTATVDGGYGITMSGPIGGTHKYFFTYTDLNVRPDIQFLSEALKNFQPI